MSPEQCPAKPLTVASDQYSLGIVLYEMLTGRPPFTGSTLAIQIAHNSTPPQAIQSLRPEVPLAIAEAVHRMLAKEPPDRWPDVAEAISACGALPMGASDPLRTEIVRLAGMDLAARRPMTRTPISPRPGAAPASDPGLRAVSAIQIQPLDEPIRLGDSVQLKARVAARSGETLPGRTVSWSSEKPATASVSADGLLRALDVGETVIVARSEGVSGSLAVAVQAPIPVSMRVTAPARPLEIGERHQLTFEIRDRRGNYIEGLPVDWSTNAPSAALVSEHGEVEAIGEGRATITGRCVGVEGSCLVAVAPLPVATVAIPNAPDTLSAEQTVQLVAKVVDRLGRPLPNRVIEWRSENPKVAVVSPNGLLTAREPGQVRIVAASEGKSGFCTIDVGSPRVAKLAIGPHDRTAVAGNVVHLRAVGFDVRGRELRDRTFAWRSSDPDVVAIDGEGAARAKTAGTAEITVACDDVTATTTLAITPRREPALVPPREAPPAKAMPLLATVAQRPPGRRGKLLGALAAGAVGLILVSWLVLRPTAEPVASAVPMDSAPSETVAKAPAVTAPPPLSPAETVSPAATLPPNATKARLVLKIPSGEVHPGDTVPLEAQFIEGSGKTLPMTPAWTSSNQSVFKPFPKSGRGLALASGEVVLTASIPNAAPATVRLIVKDVAPERIEVAQVPESLAIGNRVTLSARVLGSGGRLLDTPVAWRSKAPNIAFVDDRGVVTARESGTAEVEVAAAGKTIAVSIRVPAPRAPAAVQRQEVAVAPPPPPTAAAASPNIDAEAIRNAGTKAASEIAEWFRAQKRDQIRRAYANEAGGPSTKELDRFAGNVLSTSVAGEPSVDPGPPASVRFRLAVVYDNVDRKAKATVSVTARLISAAGGWELQSFGITGKLP